MAAVRANRARGPPRDGGAAGVGVVAIAGAREVVVACVAVTGTADRDAVCLEGPGAADAAFAHRAVRLEDLTVRALNGIAGDLSPAALDATSPSWADYVRLLPLGYVAGPRVLEHIVDTVLYFEGDTHSSFRLVRAIKNRFGAVNEIGVFAMTEKGLKGVANPSAIFLSTHGEPVAVRWQPRRAAQPAAASPRTRGSRRLRREGEGAAGSVAERAGPATTWRPRAGRFRGLFRGRGAAEK